MLNTRLIPCLLISNGKLVKGIEFKNHRYIGDPLNAVRLFNTYQAHELMLLDISANQTGKTIDPELVHTISTECFMPLAVGGGITSLEQARALFTAGSEKVVINTAGIENPNLITDIANVFGKQSIVASIDVKRNQDGECQVVTHSGTKPTSHHPVTLAKTLEAAGCGELMITSIDQDGKMSGYDAELVQMIQKAVKVPVIASGGAGSLSDCKTLTDSSNVAATAAGSMFVFHGRRRAVLVTYPDEQEIESVFPDTYTHAQA